MTKGFSVHYGKIRAVDNIDIRAPRRSIGLLGPNGAGKTTLLRALLGFLKPKSGTATVLGYDIYKELNEIWDHVGYSPEFAPKIPDISAQKYVSYIGQLAGLSSIDASQRAYDSLYYVGLGEERYRMLGEFSQGMMQKAKLAAALVHDPDLIILDEPTDGLDPEGRAQMLELIENLYKDEGKSIIVSTHLLFDVQRVCDWALIIGNGRLIASGNLNQLLSDTSDVIRIRVAGNLDTLLNRLRARGLDFQVDDENNVDISRVDNIEMMILDIINSEPSLSIRYLGKRERTLQDVFISLVEGESDLE